MVIERGTKRVEFREIVPEYNSRFFLVRNLFYERIETALSFVKMTDDSSILEVGCGNGVLIMKIRKMNKHPHITGIDINENIKNLKFENYTFKVEDVTKLSFPENIFDIVFSLDTLEHVEDINNALREIRRVLKPGGILVISGPTENFFYKFCRFLIKGTLSGKKGPSAGPHHHIISGIARAAIVCGFSKEKEKAIPSYIPFPLFKIFLFKNKK